MKTTWTALTLPIEKAELALRLLLEGNSASTVERVTEGHHTTILKLLILAGEECERIIWRIKFVTSKCGMWNATGYGRSSGKSKSACVPKTIRILVTPTASLPSSDTANWFKHGSWQAPPAHNKRVH